MIMRMKRNLVDNAPDHRSLILTHPVEVESGVFAIVWEEFTCLLFASSCACVFVCVCAYFCGFGLLAIVCLCACNCLYLSLFLCFCLQSLVLVFVRNSPAIRDCLLHRATCDDGQHLDQKTNIIQGFCWRDEVVADRHEESEGAGGKAEGEQVQLAILARRVHLDIPMRMRVRMKNNDSDKDDDNRIEREESIGKAER